ncbi:MAG: amidase [Thalassobius sp.]|nr:amidase [Thalassovita sp.]
MKKPRPFILAETNWKSVKETKFDVAVLPWGATEAHNYHLPYATDSIQNEYVAALAAEKAWEKGAKVIVLPNVPFGVNTGQLDVDLCINMNLSTQIAVLKDIVDVLSRQKIQKLIIMNGHGGNNFKQVIRELSFFYPDVFVCAFNWFNAADWNLYFDEPGDHAGEMETSAIMHIAPELVLPLEEAGDGYAKKFKLKAFKEGWVQAQRAWTQVTKDTGVGNPYAATAKKGEKYLDACTDNIATFFLELGETPLDEIYE